MDLNYVFAALIAAFMIAGMIYDAGFRNGKKELAKQLMNEKFGWKGREK